MGMSSSVRIFQCLSSALIKGIAHWFPNIFKSATSSLIHAYVDDIVGGSSSHFQALLQRNIVKVVGEWLGIAWKDSKDDLGTRLDILGIHTDFQTKCDNQLRTVKTSQPIKSAEAIIIG